MKFKNNKKIVIVLLLFSIVITSLISLTLKDDSNKDIENYAIYETEEEVNEIHTVSNIDDKLAEKLSQIRVDTNTDLEEILDLEEDIEFNGENVRIEAINTEEIVLERVEVMDFGEEDHTQQKINGKLVYLGEDVTDMLMLHQRGVKYIPEKENEIDIMDLFNLRLAEKTDKNIKLSNRKNELTSPQYKRVQDLTPQAVEKFISGAWGWDYRNKANKDDFLSFKAGTYFYNDLPTMTADKLYEEIHKRIVKHGLKFDYHFDFSKAGLYSNYDRGGQVISGILNFKYSSDKDSKLIGYEPNQWYQVGYEADLYWGSKTDTDDWQLWFGEDPIVSNLGYFVK